ncbi:TPA: hypothetical protein MDK39_002314 [Citrobacter freundii]|uniref:hypothetical protein n=1 Tax=Salmonella enterica TaxID=28901 RepID=UPI0022A63ADD|nr:hypothetical protein [Citrobacter freundii]HAU6860871.1 ead/Ea22-like family protein [Salmonella enterica subsp. enterica serovar Senftenberg]ELT9553977.1 hypothetical protein [Citrobacter freundii]HBU6201858.1 hypothetical protein [Citrobacter freundii]HBU9823937.1 hypothetical protein [Citrobacter freundii]
MKALNKQALIAKIKKQTESFDTVVLKEDEANALLGELESQQTFQQAFFRQSLMYDVVAEAYEEAKEQIAKDVEIKSRLCLESNSLFDRLRAAEKRIAELEVFISQSCYVFDGRDADISDSYIDASTSSLMPKVNTKNEGEPCHYCSDGSYSGLPGGACEHCMGTGLDNPTAGIGVKGD